jgi:ABC-type uncharacterized transport system auxiliary subunit
MKKLLALLACAALLAACGHKSAPTPAPVAASEPAPASEAAEKVSEQNTTAKPATYDPNLRPATTAVTVNLGASH